MSFREFDVRGFCKSDSNAHHLDIAEAYDIATSYIESVINSAEVRPRDVNYASGEVNSFHALHKCEELMRMYESSGLIDYVSSLLDQDSEIRGAELFAKPARIGLPSPWHQDNFYWCLERGDAVTIWIACAPVGPLNGGLSYLAGSHKLGTLDHEDSNAPGSSQTIRSDLLEKALLNHDQVTHHLSPGEFLVHHSNTIHGSADNHSAFPRTGLTLQLKAKSDQYDLKRQEHYQERLKEQIQQRTAEGR